MQLKFLPIALALALGCLASAAEAHPGGLNASGCHNDRKHGGYHCHRTGSAARPLLGNGTGAGSPFVNCSAARAAGAAPVRRGDPGYGSHLDRDGDGIGCE